jgi:hypothetical protein
LKFFSRLGFLSAATIASNLILTAGPVLAQTGWQFVASDSTTFSLQRTESMGGPLFNVRFGANGHWAYRGFSATQGPIACNDATFGDPLPGTIKHCEAYQKEDGWTYLMEFLAMEGQYIGLDDPVSQLSYGADDGWVARFGMQRGTLCSNATFGDPKPNVTKACYRLVIKP